MMNRRTLKFRSPNDTKKFNELSLVMHLSAAIPGGWPRGTPGHLHQDIYKFHLPRASILPQKATTVPPPPPGA